MIAEYTKARPLDVVGDVRYRESCRPRQSLHGVGARVTYEKVRAGNSVLRTRYDYERLPSACKPGAFVVLGVVSRALFRCAEVTGSWHVVPLRCPSLRSYALICSSTS